MTQERLDEVLEKHKLWRKQKSGGERAYLLNEDLRGMKIKRGVSFKNTFLKGADLRGMNLEEASFRWADLRNADFRNADLRNADFRWADLKGAELWGANLFGVIGDGREIKTIRTEKHPIVLTKYFMQISHEAYSYGEWWSFTDEQVLEAEGRYALVWWQEWKPILKQIVEAEGF